MKHQSLSQWIRVDTAVARSVNLERDAHDSSVLQRFQVTPVASATLHRLADALNGEGVSAWSLTGPYGTGKSAFANFLLSLMCGELSTRTQCMVKVREADSGLADRLNSFVFDRGLVPQPIGIRAVSRYESLNTTLCRSLQAALDTLAAADLCGALDEVRDQVTRLAAKEWPPTSEVVDVFRSVVTTADRPIYLVIDEFGKNLEFQSHRADQGDIFALQALAESKSIYTWVCLHQAFGAYATALSRVQREEWRKIQGRFEDRSYIEPPARSFALIRDALSIEPPDKDHEAMLWRWAAAVEDEMSRVLVDGFPPLSTSEIAGLYPFHPLSVFLIGELTRRFAQHDRTVFSFLSSGEPRAFSHCLQRMKPSRGVLPTLCLDDLYNYFSQNGVLNHGDRAENQRWLEIHSLVTARADAVPAKIRLLKTVGLLNLLSTLPGVSATTEMIHASLCTSYYDNRTETGAYLKGLVDEKTLLYRDYAREYRLWEGTDFDLDRAVLEARGRIAIRSIREVLEEIAPRHQLVAARHSVMSGTIREFAVKWCTVDELPNSFDSTHHVRGTDGIVWLMLGRQQATDMAAALTAEGSPVIAAYSPSLDQVRELMLDAAAARDACKAPELERDGVARREARHRAAQAEQSLITFVDSLFAPERGMATWFADSVPQEVGSQRALSSLASGLCDRVYHACPRINNEMLNVDQLTSVAAAARNRVGEALANNPDRIDLGLTGYGPEVAVYRTVFKDTGLHRERADNGWELAAPCSKEQPQFTSVWTLIDRMLESTASTGEPMSVESVLEALRKPPFGLRLGPIPLLLTHYLLVRADEVAVYEDGVFKPFFGDAEAMLLMRRPELFHLRSFKQSGIRAEVVRTYAQIVNTELNFNDGVRNQSLLSVVVPLTEFIRSLPEYSRVTRMISPNALRLRNAITNARDPEQLLFEDVPDALGVHVVSRHEFQDTDTATPSQLQESLWSALVELRDAFEVFVDKIQKRFVQGLSGSDDETASFATFRMSTAQNAAPLIESCGDADLKAILAALANTAGTEREWLAQVGAVVMKKPLQSWRDNDLEPFTLRIEQVRERVQQLSAIKHLINRHDAAGSRRVIAGIKRQDGTFVGTIARIPSNGSQPGIEMIEVFESADPGTRSAWLSFLLQVMEAQGELQ